MVDLTPFVPTLVGSLAGVLTGEFVSILWDRHLERARETGRRERTSDSMCSELRSIADDIEHRDPNEEVAPDLALPTGAYRSSVSSGSFALLDSDVQDVVSDVYGTVERARASQEQLRQAALLGDGSGEHVSDVELQFGEHLTELERTIPAAVRKLEEAA